mmetsp:Transcript_5766/g.22455  ORF Transcript_5766/g.22455 Transcript_5766/m.22455 type:complete len:401 (-) Transcript_5766:501-1703(-)
MPLTSIANIQAKPSSRTTTSIPRLGNHSRRSVSTVPALICGYSSANCTATTSAMAAAHKDSRLRALVGNSAATALPTKGRSKRRRRDITAQSTFGPRGSPGRRRRSAGVSGRDEHVAGTVRDDHPRRAAEQKLVERVTTLAADDHEVAVLLLLLLHDQHPGVRPAGRAHAHPSRVQPGVGREFTQALQRLALRRVPVPNHDVFGHAGQAHLALERYLHGMHQHQRGLRRDLSRQLDGAAAPNGEVHGHQDSPIGFVRELTHHQHRSGGAIGDALGGRSKHHTPKEPGAAGSGHEQTGIDVVGMPDDLLDRMSDAQMRQHVDALGPAQFGRQFLQALTRVEFNHTGCLTGVGKPSPQIIESRAADDVRQGHRGAARPGKQGCPLCRVPRRRRKVGCCNDGA